MCLYPAIKKILIAKKPIRVYKVLANNGSSIYQCFKYDRGYHYFDKILEYELHQGYINKGLHSFSNPKRAKNESCDGYLHLYKVVEMWIPKGAKYVIGTDQDIVSEQLIFYPKAK